jgi:hypothetical protein
MTSERYAEFLLSFTSWCQSGIHAASAESFATLQRLDGSFTRFVFDYLQHHPELEPTRFFEGSLHRLLLLNAGVPERLELPLCRLGEDFWAEFQRAGTAFFDAERDPVVDVAKLSAGLRPAQQVLKSISRELRTGGAAVERRGASDLASFSEVGDLTVSHSFLAEGSGLSFSSGLRFPTDRVPRFRTSYSGMLGLAVQTRVSLDPSKPLHFATALALTWRETFEGFVRSWAASGRVA